MSNDSRERQKLSDTHENSSAAPESQGADLARRKFAKVGLIAAPVVMSLSSRSAFGSAYSCTISGLLSGNLSNATGAGSCAGNLPEYWKNQPNWPASCGCLPGVQDVNGNWDGSGTKFHPLFAGGKYSVDPVGNPKDFSMMEILVNYVSAVLAGNTSEIAFYELGAHSVAAYLNAWASIDGSDGFGAGVTFGLTPQQVVTLYNQNYSTNPDQLNVLFKMWNENNRDPMIVQTLAGL